MKRRIVIPARFESKRLPGKLLMDLGGKPLLQHTFEKACQCEADSVLIATDSSRITELAKQWGADVCMTKSSHTTGTDRIAEAVQIRDYDDEDLIVGQQADEPLIPVANLSAVFDDLEAHSDADVSTLADRLHQLDDVMNPSKVKVVLNQHNYAMYFSRAPIPWARESFPKVLPKDMPYLLHVGIYGYRAGFLKDYSS